MNAAHLHLILNHLPVVGAPGVALLLMLGLLRKSADVQKAALIFAVLVGLTAIPVFLTGDPAESVVEDIPGVLHSQIEAHEEAADITLATTSFLGALALGGLIAFRRRERPPAAFMQAVLVVALASAGVLGWTANLGGKIRHTEIQSAPPAGVVSKLPH
jgi:hypothetical protein